MIKVLLLLARKPSLFLMARGRGRGGCKLVVQSDFVVVYGARSVAECGSVRKIDDEIKDVENHIYEVDQNLILEPAPEILKEKSFENVSMIESSINAEKLVKSDSRNVVVDRSGGMIQDHESKPWISLFADNRIKEEGSELKFISPSVSNGKRIVRFHSEEILHEEKRWRNVLLGCVY